MIDTHMSDTTRPRVPPEPFDYGWLNTGDSHALYYERCGTPSGIPAVFLHGGPGSGCSLAHRSLLDPTLYHIVLFDQRGCGRSTPQGALHANTTAHLVADIERLRQHLGIERWLVFGGSWGATLALAYAIAHREAISGLILRGVFLASDTELDWMFADARALFPDVWAQLAELAPAAAPRDLRKVLFDIVLHGSSAAAQDAVRRWLHWESALTASGQTPPASAGFDITQALLDKYRVQAHYLSQQCFLPAQQLLDGARTLAGVPSAIIHGRLDFICPPDSAWLLHHALPGNVLRWIEQAGHSPFVPATHAALLDAGREFARTGAFAPSSAAVRSTPRIG